MKKYLLSAIMPVAGLLSLALSLNSCSKSSDADKIITDPPMATTKQVLYRKNDGNTDVNELWSVNADGTNDHKIAVALPAGWGLIDEDMTEVAKDNKTMLVAAYNENLDQYAIYKCNTDGSNATPVLTTPGNQDIGIQGYIDQSSFLYWKYDGSLSNDKELWRSNIDGTNNVKVNITLPANSYFGDEELAKVTSDGKTIVFLVAPDGAPEAIYKCNIDGTNVTLVSAETDGTASLAIQGLVSDNTLLYRKYTYTDQTDINELWKVDLNGSNKQKINISLPSGVLLQDEEMAKSFSGGQGLIFSTTTESRTVLNGVEAIYVAKIDGSAPTLIKQLNAGVDIAIQAIIE